ncbi:MAG: response regulator [Gammaproteobacteria bacterium]|nr:response regulator [Gammaproteobacteria bacterium]
MSSIERWEKRFNRERAARRQAEDLLEQRSRDLYALNQDLEKAKTSLEQRVRERTEALEKAIASLHDEAEKRLQVQKQLLESRDSAIELAELKTQFIARMSHEIRTPLNAILGLTNLLLDSPLEEQQKQKLETVRSSGQILLRIISDILDMSKIDADKLDLEFGPVNLSTLLEQSFSLVVLDAQAKGLEIVQRSPAHLPENLVLDGGRLQQIITNLLSNAVKYSEKGTITVSLEVAALDADAVPDDFAREHPEAERLWQQVTVCVADEGPGIAPGDLDRLFEPFERLGNRTDANFESSSGLGLAICKRLSKILGGDITVHSTLGKGTAFTVRIPCWLGDEADQPGSDAQALETTNISALHQSTDHLVGSAADSVRMRNYLNMAQDRPLSVLLADDYDVNRMVLSSQLETLGYRADNVANGEEVLRALHARAYDVVLMDIRMPVIDGVEATQRIRQRVDGPQPFVVAVTASALKGDRDRYLEAGMDAYISKPVDLLKLGETLDAAFQSRHGGGSAPWDGDLVDINPVDIELDELRARVGPGLEGLLAKVIPVYLRELPGRLQKLDAALTKSDTAAFAQYCHGLKGTSQSIGATELASLCSDYELAAYDGGLPNRQQFDEFKDLSERTGVALRRILGEQAAAG